MSRSKHDLGRLYRLGWVFARARAMTARMDLGSDLGSHVRWIHRFEREQRLHSAFCREAAAAERMNEWRRQLIDSVDLRLTRRAG
jgi:hypothetical protein